MRIIKSFLYNGIILTITAVIIQAMEFFFNIYISNKIGPEALGAFGLIISVYVLSITVATSGINIATTRLITEEKSTHPLINTNSIMRKCILYSLFFGLVACIILCILSKYLTNVLLHNIIPSYLFIIIAISLPFISVASALNGYFTAIRKANKNALSRFVEKTIKIVLTTYLLSLFFSDNLEFACLALILGETVCEICSCLFAYILYKFEIKKHNFSNYNKTNANKIFSIALPVAFASYIRSGISTLKQIIIPTRLEKFGMNYESAISNFGMVNGMVMPILMFPAVVLNCFSGLLIPEFSYFNANREFSKIENVTSKVFRVTIPFAIGFMGIFWIYANDLSLLFYNSTNTAFYIKMLCPLIIFMYLDNIIDSILKGLDKQVDIMKCNIFEGIVSILCTFFLLPILGINGYILSIYISVILNFVLSLSILLKCTKIPLNLNNILFKPIAYILFLKLVLSFLPITNLVEILIFIICYGIYLLHLFLKSAKINA